MTWRDDIKKAASDDFTEDSEEWKKEIRRIMDTHSKAKPMTEKEEQKWMERVRRELINPVDMSDEIHFEDNECCKLVIEHFAMPEYEFIHTAFPKWSNWFLQANPNECDDLKRQLEDLAENDIKSQTLKQIQTMENKPIIISEGVTEFIEAIRYLLSIWEECELSSQSRPQQGERG